MTNKTISDALPFFLNICYAKSRDELICIRQDCTPFGKALCGVLSLAANIRKDVLSRASFLLFSI